MTNERSDMSYADYEVNRNSMTGFIIFVNKTHQSFGIQNDKIQLKHQLTAQNSLAYVLQQNILLHYITS